MMTSRNALRAALVTAVLGAVALTGTAFAATPAGPGTAPAATSHASGPLTTLTTTGTADDPTDPWG